MAQVFRDCCLRAFGQTGLPGMFHLWALTLADWLKSALEQHLQKGVHMSKAQFVRISAWALILGAVVLLLGTIAAVSVSEASSQYDARYRPTDPFFQATQMILFPTAVLLITVGLVGLYARYGKASGRLGQTGLIVGILGGIVCFLSMGTLLKADLANTNPWWSVMLISITMLFGGLALFGIATLRSHVLPHGNYLPLVAGLWVPMIVVIIGGYGAITDVWLQVSDLIAGILFVITGFGLLALGQILRNDTRSEAMASGD
jgi:FtsH-binding integral membrane protein